MSKDRAVFNPGAPAPVHVTLHFASLEDAAWLEAAIVARKRDGHLPPLMQGILSSTLDNVSNLIVTKNGEYIGAEDLRKRRMGEPVL